MSTYKITNITNFLGKRDYKYNSNLDVEFVDNMIKKIVTIKPNDNVYLTIPTLPLSVHRLRVKNLITVSEVDDVILSETSTKETPVKETPKPENVLIDQVEIKKIEKKVIEKKEPEK